VNGEHLHGKIRGVLYVPGLGINLYSIGTATDAGLKVVFDDDTVSFAEDIQHLFFDLRDILDLLHTILFLNSDNHLLIFSRFHQ
jgi:hypothetical protein